MCNHTMKVWYFLVTVVNTKQKIKVISINIEDILMEQKYLLVTIVSTKPKEQTICNITKKHSMKGKHKCSFEEAFKIINEGAVDDNTFISTSLKYEENQNFLF